MCNTYHLLGLVVDKVVHSLDEEIGSFLRFAQHRGMAALHLPYRHIAALIFGHLHKHPLCLNRKCLVVLGGQEPTRYLLPGCIYMLSSFDQRLDRLASELTNPVVTLFLR